MDKAALDKAVETASPTEFIEMTMSATLGDILYMILAHRRENPTHGENCACMDRFAWLMRAQMREVIEAPYYDRTEEERKAVWSLGHVLGMITRSL